MPLQHREVIALTQVHRYSSLKPKLWWQQPTGKFDAIRDFVVKNDRFPTVAELRERFPSISKKQAARQLKAFRNSLGLRGHQSQRPVSQQVKERATTGRRKVHPFYDSDRWRALRWDVLKRDGAVCVVCGASKKTGAVLHVDHIQPRSLRPDLEWEPDNLQVLCQECNLGKSNRDSTDFRA